MIIRRATEADTPGIVQLLRESLGESLVRKTEAAWFWKHNENPFGKSPVLVAVEGKQIIGVRAFMQWQFERDGRTYRALRAVDTATHPEHQGKGVFKKLTFKLVEEAQIEGYDFIFNTPNEQSKPGYLKMGWKEQGRLPIRLKPFFFSFLDKLPPSEFCINLSKAEANDAKLKYWNWRYANNPIVSYHQLNFGNSGIAFFRIKNFKYFRELRICDIQISKGDLLNFRTELARAAKSFECRLISIGNYPKSLNAILSKSGFVSPINKGLLLTSRELNTKPNDYFAPFSSIDMDLGTFELF